MQGGIGASASKDTEAGQKYLAWALVEVDEGSVPFELLGGVDLCQYVVGEPLEFWGRVGLSQAVVRGLNLV